MVLKECLTSKQVVAVELSESHVKIEELANTPRLIYRRLSTSPAKDFLCIYLKQYDLNILRNNQWFLEMQKILNMSFEDFDILSKGGQA